MLGWQTLILRSRGLLFHPQRQLIPQHPALLNLARISSSGSSPRFLSQYQNPKENHDPNSPRRTMKKPIFDPPRREESSPQTEGKQGNSRSLKEPKDEPESEPDTAYDPTRVFQAPWKKKYSFRRRDEHWYSEKMYKFVTYDRLEDAVALLDEMRFHYVKPNVPVYNTLLVGCSKRGDIDLAMKLYNELKKVGLRPDGRTFNLLFATLGAVKRSREISKSKVQDLAQEMERFDVIPNHFIQNSMIKAYSRLGDLAEVVKVFENLKYLDIKPDKTTYAVVINAFAKTGEVQDAYTFLKEAESKNIPLDTFMYNSFLSVCLAARKDQDLELAFPVFERMKQSAHVKPNAVTFTNMLSIGKRLGGDRHKLILDETVQALEKNEFGLDDTFLKTLLGGFSETDDEQTVYQIFQKVKDLKMDTVTTYALHLKYLAWRLKHRLQTKDKYPARKKVNRIVEGFIAKSQEIYQEMQNRGFVPDEQVIRHLAMTARFSGRPEFAAFVKEQMDKYAVNPSMETLQVLLHSFRAENKYKVPANEVLARLIELDQQSPKKFLGDADEQPVPQEEGPSSPARGVYVDPEEEDFDFTRVNPRKKML